MEKSSWIESIDAITDASEEGVLVLDPVSNEILFSNRKLDQLLGYEKRELLGKNLKEILPESGLIYKFFDIQKQIFISQKLIWQLLKKNGSTLSIEFTVAILEKPVTDREVLLFYIQDKSDLTSIDMRIHFTQNLIFAIRQIKENMSSESNPLELLRLTCEKIRNARDFKIVWGVFYDENRNLEYFFSVSKEFPEFPQISKFFFMNYPNQSPMNLVMRQQFPSFQYYPNLKEEFPEWMETLGFQDDLSSLTIPVSWNQNIYGAFEIITEKKNGFVEDDIMLLQELGSDLGFAFYSIESDKKLKESEWKLRTFFSTLNSGFVIVNQFGVTEEFAEIYKFILFQVFPLEKGRNPFYFLKTILVEAYLEKLKESFYKQKPIEFEFTYQLFDEEKTFSVRITPVRKFRGIKRPFLLLVNDISESKLIQQQLVDSAKLASVGELAASVAHEINNPLQSALLYLDDLINIEEENPTERKKILRKVEDANLRIRDLVKGLLDLGRTGESDRAVASPYSILLKVIELVEVACRKGNITIKQISSPNLPYFKVRQIEIEQVLLNVIMNSINALNESKKENFEKRIQILLTKEEFFNREWILYNVTDNGDGMDETILNRAFNPFFTSREASKGSGLGLSISKKIIQSHNGDIRLFSTPGEGTTTLIRIPLGRDIQ